MDTAIFIILPLFFITFIAIAFSALSAPRKKLPEELGLVPEFEEICGARVGFVNYTWPFVRHSIYKEFIVIKLWKSEFIIPRVNFTVESSDGIISSGITYKTSKYLGYDFRIWSSSKSQVLEILAKA